MWLGGVVCFVERSRARLASMVLLDVHAIHDAAIGPLCVLYCRGVACVVVAVAFRRALFLSCVLAVTFFSRFLFFFSHQFTSFFRFFVSFLGGWRFCPSLPLFRSTQG